MFGDDLDSPDELLTRIVEQLVADGLSPKEIESRLEATCPDAIAKGGSHLLTRLRATADDMFQDRRQIRQGFQERQREKWGKPLDLLLMLIEAARETGEEYNATGQATPGVGQDYVFDVLRRLHARGCLIASEIHWMLEGGYASGAMARWRTLHELTAVGYFVVDHGQDTAERYLLHHQAEAYQAAVQYNNHAHNINLDLIPPEDLQRMRSRRDALCQRFGSAYKDDWGWAAAALAPRLEMNV